MKHRKALIVDDEQDTCFLLSGILKQNKYDAGFVYSIAEAKKRLEIDKPDVIFLDNNLGDGMGVEFIPEILEIHPDVRIIVITAFDTLPTRTQAFKNGAHYLLGKPFEKKTINNALDTVFAG
jgi:two-component system OmpR family response regulator